MRRRRIAIAYDCLFPISTGGGERLYRGYAERLVRGGEDVEYLTARQWVDPLAPEAFGVVPVTARLTLYDGSGVRRTSAALRFALGLGWGLLRRRRRYAAVIVSGLPILNVFAARAALAGSGTTVVVDYLEVWGRRQWLEYAGVITGTIAWALQRAALRITPIATCHSDLTARQLRAEGFRGTLRVSPGLIEDTSTAALRAVPADPPYVLYVGRHIPDKQVETLPAAVAIARRSIPDLRLVILGEGPTTGLIRRAVAAADGADWTDLPGFVDQDRLDELMAGAACLANPSRREGYGLVVVESSAHGTPVVLVQDPGNAAVELVSTGQNGFIAPSAHPSDIAGALVQAVEGGSDLRRRARSWYEDAIRSRTLDATVAGIIEAIDAAHTRHRRPTDQQGNP